MNVNLKTLYKPFNFSTPQGTARDSKPGSKITFSRPQGVKLKRSHFELLVSDSDSSASAAELRQCGLWGYRTVSPMRATALLRTCAPSSLPSALRRKIARVSSTPRSASDVLLLEAPASRHISYYDDLNGRGRRELTHTSALPYSTGCIPKMIHAVEGGCRRLGVAGVDDGRGREEEGGRKKQNKMGIIDRCLRIAMMDLMQARMARFVRLAPHWRNSHDLADESECGCGVLDTSPPFGNPL
ncbi:hypothetical protein B0H14DRAFT_3146339 [Mycena olivaceomarginata]|nr:hypothetical protein B0H14DRAFT_3159050 [Mycena olivaceomarginata]KAJ7822566.1 hypothetical protein B0H14DRAFT_3146339 [Mycena olivaceomarginata]